MSAPGDAAALSAAWPRPGVDDLTRALAPREGRLPVPRATQGNAWLTDAAASLTQGLLGRASAERGTPWPQPRASDAARFHRDGDRVRWEAAAFERQHRLSRAVLAALDEPSDLWLDEVTDGVLLLCEQSSWCWPAHDDAWSRRGSMLAVPEAPYLDLGAGEVLGQLAWIDHTLGAVLEERTPGLRARLHDEAQRRVFQPFLDRRDWHWLGLQGRVHNWNPWIHGNVIVGALALVPDPRACATLVATALEGLDRFLVALPDDGAVDEGYGYWWNGVCRALEALDLVRHATGGRHDALAQSPALAASVSFPHSLHLRGDWYVNPADATARDLDPRPWDALHRAALATGNRAAAAFARSHRAIIPDEAFGLGRLLRCLADAAWLAAGDAPPPLPGEVWFPSVEVFVAREHAGSPSGLALWVKGGHNAENHNHNDVGTVGVAIDGVPVVVDPGRPTYTAQTFGADRYSIWTMQSQWHSVPSIGGVQQAPGRVHAAASMAVSHHETHPGARLEIGGAYPLPVPCPWWRTATLHRDAGEVVVRDEWDAGAVAGQSVVHVMVAGTLRRTGPSSVEVQAIEGGGRVRIAVAEGSLEITTRPLDDPLLTEVWGERLTRLDLRTVDGSGVLEWRVSRCDERITTDG